MSVWHELGDIKSVAFYAIARQAVYLRRFSLLSVLCHSQVTLSILVIRSVKGHIYIVLYFRLLVNITGRTQPFTALNKPFQHVECAMRMRTRSGHSIPLSHAR